MRQSRKAAVAPAKADRKGPLSPKAAGASRGATRTLATPPSPPLRRNVSSSCPLSFSPRPPRFRIQFCPPHSPYVILCWVTGKWEEQDDLKLTAALPARRKRAASQVKDWGKVWENFKNRLIQCCEGSLKRRWSACSALACTRRCPPVNTETLPGEGCGGAF